MSWTWEAMYGTEHSLYSRRSPGLSRLITQLEYRDMADAVVKPFIITEVGRIKTSVLESCSTMGKSILLGSESRVVLGLFSSSICPGDDSLVGLLVFEALYPAGKTEKTKLSIFVCEDGNMWLPLTRAGA